jgi:squalene-hopene/tetraprenyl-beta-curcumene cyclase
VISPNGDRRDAARTTLIRRLLERRAAADHWDGHLADSALSTATAVLALHTSAQHGYRADNPLAAAVIAGTAWLLRYQNADGGWGDTVRSRSNISTTAIVWATDRRDEWRRRCPPRRPVGHRSIGGVATAGGR